MKNFYENWRKITSDQNILDIVCHCHIEFLQNPPIQKTIPYQRICDKKQEMIIDLEIQKLLELGVLIEVQPDDYQFISPIFTVPKKDNKNEHRMILNLKQLNEYIEPHHFKMETFESALKLVKQNCYFASIDLRHAYYSIHMAEEDQKYLRFIWKEKIFQYTCLPNGITSAPRIFTKLMKPVYATLRTFGHKNVAYIDDSLLLADSYLECSKNVSDTVMLLKQLGFFVHDKKSVFIPSKRIVFLGNIIDSVEMTVTLPIEKIKRIKEECLFMQKRDTISIRYLSKIIGLLVSSFSAVDYGPLHYRILETEKIEALKRNLGNYDGTLRITDHMKQELKWWSDNLENQKRIIDRGNPDIIITTDASLEGWGAIKDKDSVNGRWNESEVEFHINYLELLAVFYALKCLCKNIKDKHIQILCDNTSAVAHINNMGGIKSKILNQLTRTIWFWCCDRNIWISSAHIPGKINPADLHSRKFNDNVEWMLDRFVFQKLVQRWKEPDIDLFASRLNYQIARFASWKPDPEAEVIDAFSISWSNNYNYLFPPFSLISRCVQKIVKDQADCLMVLPLWPTQIWFPLVMELLIDKPVLLPRKQRLLSITHTEKLHPLRNQIRLIACRLSGIDSKVKEFQRTLPVSYLRLGEQVQKSNTQYILENGIISVTKGKLIHYNHL